MMKKLALLKSRPIRDHPLNTRAIALVPRHLLPAKARELRAGALEAADAGGGCRRARGECRSVIAAVNPGHTIRAMNHVLRTNRANGNIVAKASFHPKRARF